MSPGFTMTGTTLVISTTSNITLTGGVKLEVISRNSKVFGDNKSPEMKFLLDKTASLPVGTFDYANTEALVYLESGLILTDEEDGPLEGL